MSAPPINAPTSPEVEAQPTPRPRLHLDFLDGTRACAALYVVLYHGILHTWNMARGGEQPPKWFGLSHFFLQSGRFAVSLFIVISGFCLMLPVVRNRGVLKGGALPFFFRRAKRILPPYYFAIAVSLLLFFTLIGPKSGFTWATSSGPAKSWLTFHGTLMQNWKPFFNPNYSQVANITLMELITAAPEKREAIGKVMGIDLDINGPMWSIAVEWQIYFFFPLLVFLWRKIGAKSTVSLAMILTYSFYLKFHGMVHGWMAPHYLGLFTLGMLGANIAYGEEEKWVRLREKRFWHPLAYTLWAIVFLVNINPLMGLMYSYLVDLIAGPASMCLLVAAAKPGYNRLQNLLSRPKLVFVGTFSYSIYLMHDPLLRVLLNYVLFPLDKMKVLQYYMLISVGLAIIVGIAYIFHRLFERPFMNTPPAKRNAGSA